MEEKILSGYCRCLDGSRMVTAEQTPDGWEVDCHFGKCPYESECPVADGLREAGICV